jgi:hypothetical protein
MDQLAPFAFVLLWSSSFVSTRAGLNYADGAALMTETAVKAQVGFSMADPEAIYHWRRLDDRIVSGSPAARLLACRLAQRKGVHLPGRHDQTSMMAQMQEPPSGPIGVIWLGTTG